MSFKFLCFYLCLLPGIRTVAQPDTISIRTFIDTCRSLGQDDLVTREELTAFYSSLNYHPQWISTIDNSAQLWEIFSIAGVSGLDNEKYQQDIVEKRFVHLLSSGRLCDSLLAEVTLSSAAIRYFNELAYGVQPPLSYQGLVYKPSCYQIPSLVASYARARMLPLLVSFLNASVKEASAILRMIGWFEKVVNDPAYHEELIKSDRTTPDNIPLIQKLQYLGLFDSVDKRISEKQIIDTLKKAQILFNLLADGILRSTTLTELNIPVTARLKQLKLSLGYYRWIECLRKTGPVIVVGIPAAHLDVYRNDSIILNMRLIVGKPSTPTPTLSSRLSEIVLNPYWIVPNSIITELLPSIRNNPGYLNANHFELLTSGGKKVDPNTVNWKSVSAARFPYTVRQLPGSFNALGQIKFYFHNPFTVYLHDTPGKALFMLNKRYFSHGCMRMECPLDLGHLLLGKNMLTLDAVNDQSSRKTPVNIPLDRPVPVIIWYNPVRIDKAGQVIFFEDVYRKFTP